MAAITALRQLVLLEAPGCPVGVADAAIMLALNEFFNKSRAYRHTPAAIPVVASTGNYAPTLPADTEIASLLSATLDDEPLTTKRPSEIPKSFDVETGSPEYAIRYSVSQVGLRKVPDAAGSLKVELALRLVDGATTYPDEFHDQYKEHIAAGALARLMAQPRKPWSAPELVTDKRLTADAGIRDAAYQADRGHSPAPLRTVLSLIGGR